MDQTAHPINDILKMHIESSHRPIRHRRRFWSSLSLGWDISIEELMKTGDRIFNLCRVFNVREGITRKDDCLPKRFFEPLPEGPLKGVSFTNEEFNMMLDYLYEFRGWDMTGIPTKEKLVELGLHHAVDEYTRLGIIPQP